MIAAIISGAVSFACSLVKWTFEGLENVITHPVTLTIVAIAWLHGDWHGKHVDALKVAVAKTQVTKLVTAAKETDNAEKLRAKAAIAARDAEEAKPVPPPPAPAATAAAPAAAKPAGVRHATSRHREASSLTSVFGLQGY